MVAHRTSDSCKDRCTLYSRQPESWMSEGKKTPSWYFKTRVQLIEPGERGDFLPFSRGWSTHVLECRSKLACCGGQPLCLCSAARSGRCVAASHSRFQSLSWSGKNGSIFALTAPRTLQVSTFAKLVGQSFEVQCKYFKLKTLVVWRFSVVFRPRKYAVVALGAVGIRSRPRENSGRRRNSIVLQHRHRKKCLFPSFRCV